MKKNTIEDSPNSDKNDIKLSELFGDGFNEEDLLVTDKLDIDGNENENGSPNRKKSKDYFNQKYINLRDSETQDTKTKQKIADLKENNLYCGSKPDIRDVRDVRQKRKKSKNRKNLNSGINYQLLNKSKSRSRER